MIHALKHFQYVAARTGNARDIFGARIRQQWPKIFTYSLIETFFGAAVKKKQDLMLKMYFPPAQKKKICTHHWYFKWGFFAMSGSRLPCNRKDTFSLRQKFAKMRS